MSGRNPVGGFYERQRHDIDMGASNCYGGGRLSDNIDYKIMVPYCQIVLVGRGGQLKGPRLSSLIRLLSAA